MKFLGAVFLMFFSGASALNAETVKQAHTEVQLVSESSSVKPGQSVQAGVLFKMEPGWHVYWLNAGDSGLPPEIKWELPEGWAAGETQWPYPEKIVQDPLVTYGYEEQVLLMSALKVPASQASGSVMLKGVVSWLACQVECVPGKAELSLPISVSETASVNPEWARLFSETRGRLPLSSQDRKVEAVISGEKLLIRVPAEKSEELTGLYFFAESNDLIRHPAPQVQRKISGAHELEAALNANRPENIQRVRGILVTSAGWRGPGSEKAYFIDVPVTGTAPQTGMTFLTAVLFAFLGGLILNLMPCVLPVLSLKILNFMQEAAENPRTLFAHGLIFTAGVLVSFWSLAGLLIIFQAAGKYAGWGFQLQSPAFLAVLTFIFFLFALNLLGIFEIGTSLTGIRRPGLKGFAGSFSSGIFATVVATPCTAPFMGAALGFSLSQPAWISFLVFTALGFGMAAPYLLLCSRPGLLKFVPRPGAWMVRLKQFLAFPLLATCAWLLWVLSLQRGTQALMPVFSGLLLASFAAWIFGKWGNPAVEKKARNASQILSAFFLIAGLAAGLWGVQKGAAEKSKAHSGSSENKISWESFSLERLGALLNEGRPVFIDFTAAWCLTCQVNERIALDVPKVAQAFRESGVTALKADWTSQDPEITRALSQYGRNSIPLYVLYKAGSKEPVLLPELLTPGIVLEFLKDISKE